jgi:hypothetical protein
MYPSRREELGLWLNRNHLLGAGAEVGVAAGEYAANIASLWAGQRLWLIDPWEKQDPALYRESTNDTAPWSLWLAQCKTMAAADNRIGLMQLCSIDAATRFSDGELDFVYIDGAHHFSAVVNDLDVWWPKVKTGGIIGGHDFIVDKIDEGWYCQVSSAVIPWCRDHLLTFAVTPCSSFWIRKI